MTRRGVCMEDRVSPGTVAITRTRYHGSAFRCPVHIPEQRRKREPGCGDGVELFSALGGSYTGGRDRLVLDSVYVEVAVLRLAGSTV